VTSQRGRSLPLPAPDLWDLGRDASGAGHAASPLGQFAPPTNSSLNPQMMNPHNIGGPMRVKPLSPRKPAHPPCIASLCCRCHASSAAAPPPSTRWEKRAAPPPAMGAPAHGRWEPTLTGAAAANHMRTVPRAQPARDDDVCDARQHAPGEHAEEEPVEAQQYRSAAPAPVACNATRCKWTRPPRRTSPPAAVGTTRSLTTPHHPLPPTWPG
jgi:hypothetical protein